LDKDGLENGTPFLFSEAYLTVGWTWKQAICVITCCSQFNPASPMYCLISKIVWWSNFKASESEGLGLSHALRL
jgi:hypothetical protein